MKARNAMEIFSVLDKSNCRLCGEKTCLAFAGGVFLGRKKLRDCPKITEELLEKLAGVDKEQVRRDEQLKASLDSLKHQLLHLNLGEVAERTGGVYERGRLIISVLGKPVSFSADGEIITDLHTIPWLFIPLLEYVISCKGSPVKHEWISYRDIPGGKEKYGLFKRRAEEVMLQLADKYTEFFNDILHMFDGRDVDKQFAADVSVQLFPFPLVPMMICYWRSDEGMGSSLNLYFDRSVSENLRADSAFNLGTGIAQMFDKLATHHAF